MHVNKLKRRNRKSNGQKRQVERGVRIAEDASRTAAEIEELQRQKRTDTESIEHQRALEENSVTE